MSLHVPGEDMYHHEPYRIVRHRYIILHMIVFQLRTVRTEGTSVDKLILGSPIRIR